MTCSICGGEGHNSRNCNQDPANTVRDRALILRVANLTMKEEKKLAERIIKDKDKIAPEGRGTIARGSQKQLPYEPTKKLKPKED
jgi:hypothetical protein